MVGVRTASLSQFAVQTRHRDCNANCEYRRRGAKKMMAGQAVRQGRWTPRPEFSKLRLAEDERWPGGFPRRPRGADQDGEALALLRGNKMSGSEFERENIMRDAPSAAPASQPAQIARGHDSRPPAQGVYHPSP